MKRLATLCFLTVLLALVAGRAADLRVSAESYVKEKERLLEADQQSREIMGNLYLINERMKFMSRKRDTLNDRIMAAEGDVRVLAKGTIELESKIKEQRKELAKRLKAIYMLGDEGVVRILFSSASAQDLDQSLKFLKIVSSRDYAALKAYEKNFALLLKKKEKMANQVKRLLSLRNSLKKQENQLATQQSSKSELLLRLGGERRKALSRMASIRKSAGDEGGDDLFDVSFYEQRKQLISPVVAAPVQRFGLIENEEFQYRFRHKGLLYASSVGQNVVSVFNGQVAFAGPIDGYGETLIVDHGDHYYSVYAHLQRVVATEGARVSTNQLIAQADGNLYFEIRHFSDAVDPENW